MAAAESSYFRKERTNGLNGIQNPAFWEPSPLHVERSERTFDRVTNDLETGILASQRLRRLQQVEQHIKQNCFQAKGYNYLQGTACETFHHENDFKLKLIESFAADHLVKHKVLYQKCISDSRDLAGSVE